MLNTKILESHIKYHLRYFQAFAAFAGINVTLAICASALCAFIAPAAAGSGIPEVKAYLNGVDAHSILAPSTLFVKVRCNCIDHISPLIHRQIFSISNCNGLLCLFSE